MLPVIAKVFTDGGVIGRNPSPLGGTWCYCLVDQDGIRASHDSGTVTPGEIGLPAVTNNYTELLAAVKALEALPAGWEGALYTDSLITLRRLERPRGAKMNGLPEQIVGRLRAASDNLGVVRFHLLGGHPTAQELYAGRRRDGMPVSVHNVFCDKECSRLSEAFRLSKATVT